MPSENHLSLTLTLSFLRLQRTVNAVHLEVVAVVSIGAGVEVEVDLVVLIVKEVLKVMEVVEQANILKQ